MPFARTPVFLMANLGSEISLLFSCKEKGEKEMANGAAQRAEKIMSELLHHPELNGGKREVEILQEIITDSLSPTPQLQIKRKEMENYFLPFALRVLNA